MPNWLYTKGVKKTQELKEKKSTISKSLITEYAKYFHLDRKSIEDALEFYPNEMGRELKDFENILKQK